MKKKTFPSFIVKKASSLVSLFAWTATKNAAESETPIIEVPSKISYFDHLNKNQEGNRTPTYASSICCAFTH